MINILHDQLPLREGGSINTHITDTTESQHPRPLLMIAKRREGEALCGSRVHEYIRWNAVESRFHETLGTIIHPMGGGTEAESKIISGVTGVRQSRQFRKQSNSRSFRGPEPELTLSENDEGRWCLLELCAQESPHRESAIYSEVNPTVRQGQERLAWGE